LKGSTAPDLHFSQLVAEHLCVPWLLIEVEPIEAVFSLCWLMSLKNSFDRGLFNEIPIYWAIHAARSRGWRRIVSGEGAELLFAGYDFLIESGPRFREYRVAVLGQTSLAETHLARKMAAEMKYPYLAPEVVSVAMQTDLDDCIFEYAAGQYVTKVPLRIAAQEVLPNSVAWRARADLEFGSGFDQLGPATRDFANFFEPPAVSANFYWDDTHRALHRIFQGIGLTVPTAQAGMYACQWCNGAIVLNRRHCPTCGAFPADRTPLFSGPIFAQPSEMGSVQNKAVTVSLPVKPFSLLPNTRGSSSDLTAILSDLRTKTGRHISSRESGAIAER
jgi:asparagine synthase (glutamine-hydrolysing)